ncbi:MAG: class I SAM-dependent RNA methyltransferase [Clostridia bacterium]|nr:class I SAM-dependent RNA methyltransferase [Clostridia bacterium]
MIDKNDFSLIIKTHAGLEQLLADEVTAAGGHEVQLLVRAVRCQADTATMYRINYTCRTALRVLQIIHGFVVNDENDLYREINKLDWPDIFPVDSTFAINANVNRSQMTHAQYVSLKAKDAVVDKFREILGTRPNVDTIDPDVRIHIHISASQGMVLLDSSGDSLHKRGYRRGQGLAPINEVLAAGMVLLSGWDATTDLLDPMCGTGTILCEAALIAQKMPSGYFRKKFGFMSWRDYQPELWNQIVETENARIAPAQCRLYGADVNQRVLAQADEVLLTTGFDKIIILKQVAFEDSSPPTDKPGMIITNPPYGERIQKTDLNDFYRMIGDVLKNKFAGYTAWLITSDFGALKSVGLRTSRKITLYNGPLECRYVQYQMYRGSRKSGEVRDDQEISST